MSLFACGWLKRKVDATGEEVAEAAKARARQEKQQSEQYKAAELAAKLASDKPKAAGKQLSRNSEAVRKRALRAKQKRLMKKDQSPKPREKVAIDAEKAAMRTPQENKAAAVDFEKETHYEDARGRKRKRKRLRSISGPSGSTGAKGQRVYTDTEKELILQEHRCVKAKTVGKVDFAFVAHELRRKHPTIFGAGAPGMSRDGIGRQTVRNMVIRASRDGVADGRGRPAPLPAILVATILAALKSVVSARTTIMSAPMLQPIAIGIILASSFHELLQEGRKRRGVFCCSLDYIRGIMKDQGWRCVKPQGDTRKLPEGWAEKRWLMVLRLAYFVFVHNIPKTLVINADHTGIMFTQFKGRMWITKEAAEAKDKSVAGHGEKRQFTLLATTAATGEMLPHQVVVKGKTAKSLPNFGNYSISVNGLNTKKYQSVCYTLPSSVPAVANITSFCCTSNHWSDDITSRAYVKDIAAPYFKKKIEALRDVDPSLSKPYGEQVCILIVDCWYGWIDAGFKEWLSARYPWLRLIFVPAACTPVAQPMDAGIIAKIKGVMRKLYGTWAVFLTQEQIKKGVNPNEIKVPADVQTCKKNLFEWLSQSADKLNSDKAGIVHCWAQTKLLQAWERTVQAEASMKVKELFPNLAEVPAVDLTTGGDGGARDVGSATEDKEAGGLGKPFMETAEEDEWMEWVNWDVLCSSSSSSDA
jgi:hypothetical protein